MRKTLRERSASEWVKQINSLPKSWRGDVARVVWWDYFSDRLVSTRIPEFDAYLRPPYLETDPRSVAMGLLRLGYNHAKIKSRLFAHLPKTYWFGIEWLGELIKHERKEAA